MLVHAPPAAAKFVEERSDEPDLVLLPLDDTYVDDQVTITPVPATHGAVDAVGYVFQFGKSIIYHSGDTTVVDVDALRRFRIDVAILPINGKLDNMNGIDAARLAKEIGAKLVIPCHYDMFEFNTADPYEQFVPECKRIGQPYRVLKLGERFTYP